MQLCPGPGCYQTCYMKRMLCLPQIKRPKERKSDMLHFSIHKTESEYKWQDFKCLRKPNPSAVVAARQVGKIRALTSSFANLEQTLNSLWLLWRPLVSPPLSAGLSTQSGCVKKSKNVFLINLYYHYQEHTFDPIRLKIAFKNKEI